LSRIQSSELHRIPFQAVDAGAQHILACDIVVIGTPNYFGYRAGLFKDCFDRVRATIRDKVRDNPYVTSSSKGGGVAQALDSVDRICSSLKMAKAFESILVTRKPIEEDLPECMELGEKLARLERTEKPQTIQEARL